jgi:NitT/TauT family transport system permease protein/sulfonate transport system permease protein
VGASFRADQAGQVLSCTDRTSLSQGHLPAALPNIITGLRISFGTGWASIAAELVAARSASAIS